jgi:uncharacterized repeat protein (TIGR01451 family)
MTGILSAISGQFSKSLIMGAFMPAAVFIILGMVFLVPLFPFEWHVLKPLQALDPQWKVVVIFLLTIVLSGLLYNLNITLIKFYEGYPWEKSPLGRFKANRYKKRFRAARFQSAGLLALRTDIIKKAGANDARIGDIEIKKREVDRRLNNDFPTLEHLVLPTRLGNVIRSFEDYADERYGMSAITLWPHLISKIDKDYAAAIDDSKTSFDFMLNSATLSFVMMLLLSLVGLYHPIQFASPWLWIPWVLEIAAFAVLAHFFYRQAVDRAYAWGYMVRAAFDLYRWKLLEQLGYQRVPTTVEEEKVLWDIISRQMMFGYPPQSQSGRPAEYGPAQTYVRCVPPILALDLVRSISKPDADGVITVYVRVRNTDPVRTAQSVKVIDTVPAGFDYEWISATVGTQPVGVWGANPYRFELDNLAPQMSWLLIYRIIPRGK